MSSSSLLNFLKNEILPRLEEKPWRILEIGCGSRSQFEDLSEFSSSAEILAIDSDKNLNFRTSHKSITFMNADLSDANLSKFLGGKFDLIFDAHCFHCITNLPERKQAFLNVEKLLKPGGLFAGEMMIQSRRQKFEVEQRYVPDSLELEQEILGSGLRIIYFVVSRDLVFELNSEMGLECDLVRVIATK